MRRSVLLVIMLLLGTIISSSLPAAPPTSVELDFNLWFNHWLEQPSRQVEPIIDPAKALSQDLRKTRVAAIHGMFRQALTNDAERRHIFSSEGESLREGLTRILSDGFETQITGDDLQAWLPTADRLQEFDLQVVQSETFSVWAGPLWDDGCDEHLFELLSDPLVINQPEWYFGLSSLGLRVLDDSGQEKVASLVRKNYLERKSLPEPNIRILNQIVEHPNWQQEEGRYPIIRQMVRRGLADYLTRNDVVELGAENQLSDIHFLSLARLVDDWEPWKQGRQTPSTGALPMVSGLTGWSLKLGMQLTDSKLRNDRARRLLTSIVKEPGDHYRLFDGGPSPDAFGLVSAGLNADLFVDLHQGDPMSPWKELVRKPENRRSTVSLMKRFFDPTNRSCWSLELFDILAAEYYRDDQDGFFKVLRLIVTDDSVPETSPVRCRLLTNVSKGEFPFRWSDRWQLAWDAVEGKSLVDRIPLEKETTPVVRLIGGVCRNQDFPESSADTLQQVNLNYPRVLDRIHKGLFDEPRDISLSDAAGKEVMSELELLFTELGRLKRKHKWLASQLTGVNGFWDEVQRAFRDAAEKGDRSAMTDALLVMLRIAAVLGDVDHVERLAKSTGEMFGVTKGGAFRSPAIDRVVQDAELFGRISPAIVAAIQTVHTESTALNSGKANVTSQLVTMFLEYVYLPLLKTDGLADAVDQGSAAPWTQMIALYPSEAERQLAWKDVRRLLEETTFLNSPKSVAALVRNIHQEFDIDLWKNPGRVNVIGNVTLPLIKSILDRDHLLLTRSDSQSGPVLDLFIDRLKEEDAWITAVEYDRDGNAGQRWHDNPVDVLPWLDGLLSFYETRAAPFQRPPNSAVDLIQNLAAVDYEYTPETGPQFTLPEGRWQRSRIPGDRRLKVLRAIAGMNPEPSTKELMRQANTALLFPCRENHLTNADRIANRNNDYDAAKKDLIQKLETAVTGASRLEPEPEFHMLRMIVRLRHSFDTPLTDSPNSRIAALRSGLLEDPMRRKYWRALVYEEMLLRLINNPDGDGDLSDVKGRVTALLEFARQEGLETGPAPGDPAGPWGIFYALQERASAARRYLDKVGESDIMILHPLFSALADDGESELDDETSLQIVMALALLLPYYGVEPDAFLEEQTVAGSGKPFESILPRLTVLSLLSHKAKLRLAKAAETSQQLPPNHRDLLRRLLIDHNSISLMLAGRVFDNRELLKATSIDQKYLVDTVNFNILRHHTDDITVNARELLEGAVTSVQLNFQLVRQLQPEEFSDEDVLDFIIGAPSSENPELADLADSDNSPSLDDVLRTVARIAHDPKYDVDKDEDVQAAARKFQKSAKEFKPATLVWFDEAPAPRLEHCATWFCGLDGVAGRIKEQESIPVDAAWKSAATQTYGRLWRTLMFGTEVGPPVWQTAFVNRFCTAPSEDSVQLREALAAQRSEVLRFVGGDAVSSGRHKLIGIQANLKARDKLAAPQSQKSAEFLFRDRYWSASTSVVNAALLGRNRTDLNTVFPALPFVDSASGTVRPWSEADISECVNGAEDDLIFDGFEFCNEFHDGFSSDPLLLELLGPSFGTFVKPADRYGLGNIDAPPDPVDSVGYRYAAWMSGSLYAAARLKSDISQIAEADAAVTDPEGHVAASVRSGEAASGKTCSELYQLIQFRIRHNLRIQCLTDRSCQAVQDSNFVAARRSFYAWFHIDNTTIDAAMKASGYAPSGRLAAQWAPFERWCFGQDSPFLSTINEPRTLRLSADTWRESELADSDVPHHVFSLLRLLQLAPPSTQPVVKLRDDVVALWQADAASGANVVEKDCLCGDGDRRDLTVPPPLGDADGAAEFVQSSAGVPSWHGLSTTVAEPLVRLDGYEFRPVPELFADKALTSPALPPLVSRLAKQVHWRKAPAAAWIQAYDHKMSLLAAAWDLGQEQQTPGQAAPIDTFAAAGARVFPYASPYAPNLRHGRVEFLGLSKRFPSLLPENRAKREKEASRTQIGGNQLLLVQWRVNQDGTVHLYEAGSLELVDWFNSNTKN